MDVFTRMVRTIRLKYAATCVVIFAILVTMSHMGGAKVFGWYGFSLVLVLILMAGVLFLMHCSYSITPIERLTEQVHELIARALDSEEALRLEWDGKDEFACLAAALNGLLETVQSRCIGLVEENRRLKEVVSCAEGELVLMNSNGALLNVVHCSDKMCPVPGLIKGVEPDVNVWGDENRQALRAGVDAACREKGVLKTVDLSLKGAATGGRTRRLQALIRVPTGGSFPLVVFRDDFSFWANGQLCRLDERRVPLAFIAAGVAGELRNVFAVVRNAAARYAGSKKPEVQDTVATIRRAIDLGSAMMDNLVILGGEMRMHMERINAGELVRGLESRLRDEVASSGVRLELCLSEGLPAVVADRNQFAKVLVHAVKNAVEAFGSVSGRIRVLARPFSMTQEDGEEFVPRVGVGEGVLITVTDDGPGIPRHVLEHAFEPYCTTRSNGRGLGLSVANAIVGAHGGGMRILSERGVGTSVDVFLNVAKRSAEDIARLHHEFPGGEVLVVDDSKSVLRITSALLRTQKVAAHVADCRRDAIRKFGELSTRLRAVFLDAQLGDELSNGLVTSMRSIDPNVPIIVVSGYSREDVGKIFADTPPDAYLTKPYTVDELKAILANNAAPPVL